MSADSLLPRPAPGLDEPLEMLAACHERVRAQLDTLSKLVYWLPEHGADAQAARAASGVIRYFDLAAVNHHLDEEKDLLPAMLEVVPPAEKARLQELVRRVLAEHLELTAQWQHLRDSLTEIAAGRPATLAEEEVERFNNAYRTHIRFEEAEILPWAERMLGAEALAKISGHMTERRRTPA